MGVEAKKEAADFSDNEIDQIMNELDKLQGEMESSEPNLKVVPNPQPEVEAAPEEAPAEEAATESLPEEDDLLSEFHASTDENSGSMEDAVGELGTEEADSGLLASDERPGSAPAPAPVTHLPTRTTSRSASASSSSEGALRMTLTGEIQLQLQYEVGGQEVSIGFENDTLKVSLSDGTEFRIPLKR